MTFEQHARSFGSAVEAYEHGRPGYPTEVAAWLVPHAARRLVESPEPSARWIGRDAVRYLTKAKA